VITIGGAGLTEGVLKEFDATIAHHELIKVRVRAGDREVRDQIIDRLCSEGPADLVARIGNVALVYRKNSENPKIPLPI
jgi:RNA-binding protein